MSQNQTNQSLHRVNRVYDRTLVASSHMGSSYAPATLHVKDDHRRDHGQHPATANSPAPWANSPV